MNIPSLIRMFYKNLILFKIWSSPSERRKRGQIKDGEVNLCETYLLFTLIKSVTFPLLQISFKFFPKN